MNKSPILLHRIGRVVCWRSPLLYRFFGLVRRHGDCLSGAYDAWIGGYPRSANTFSAAAFRLANPKVRLATHFHIPPFVVNAVRLRKPGIFLVRPPEDTVASLTIYWKGRVKSEDCLDHYLDFYRIMAPYISSLFVAPFDVVIRDFGKVIDGLNDRFGTQFSKLPHDRKMVSECFSRIEEVAPVEVDGSPDESIIHRPSTFRKELKPTVLRDLRSSRRASSKLEEAKELYNAFCQAPSRASLLQTPPPNQVQFPAGAEVA
jgi:hypothetical protein